MKTHFSNSRPRRRGFSALLVLLVLLSVILVLLAVNTEALNRLEREVKGLEKQQIQRLAPSAKPERPSPSATNRPSATNLPSSR